MNNNNVDEVKMKKEREKNTTNFFIRILSIECGKSSKKIIRVN